MERSLAFLREKNFWFCSNQKHFFRKPKKTEVSFLPFCEEKQEEIFRILST
jgi:hypothetical protein